MTITQQEYDKMRAQEVQQGQISSVQLRGMAGTALDMQSGQIGSDQSTLSVIELLNARIKRATAVIEILRVFYADPVRRAEEIADLALR